MEGKIIVIDGLDASGKATQIKAISKYLEDELGYIKGKDYTTIDFPRYGKQSCKMVEQYLSGDFGQDPMTVDPYVASTAYCIDRAISFRTEEWREVWSNGGLILADRYTSSSIPYQGCKVDLNYPRSEGSEFKKLVNFMHELDTKFYKIPKAAIVVFLVSTKKNNETLLKVRQLEDKNRIIDIHEGDLDYLDKCRYALEVFRTSEYWKDTNMALWPTKFLFINIDDTLRGRIKSIEEIRDEILLQIYHIL